MIQKIIKVGNSAAITIPKGFLQQTGLVVGQEVAVETSSKLKTLLVKPKKEAGKTTLTPEFKEWLDKFVEEYKPILKELSHL